MPTFISLGRFTEQGVHTIGDLGERIARTRKTAEALGGEIKAVYLAMGKYDFITVFEAPDDETAAKGALAVAMAGNLRLETLRVFPEQEALQLVEAVTGAAVARS